MSSGLICLVDGKTFDTVSTKRRSSYRGHKKRLFTQQDGKCRWCGRDCTFCGNGGIPEEFTVDHVIPLAVKGTNHYRNLIGSCYNCNKNRTGKWNRVKFIVWRTE